LEWEEQKYVVRPNTSGAMAFVTTMTSQTFSEMTTAEFVVALDQLHAMVYVVRLLFMTALAIVVEPL